MNTHHAQTKSKTRVYQLASVTALVGVGTAFVLPLKDTFSPRPVKVVDYTPPVEPAAAKPPMAMGVGEAAGVLKSVISWSPDKTPTTTDTTKPTVPTETPTVALPQNEWAYLGSIIMSGKSRALVRVDTIQHMLAPGAELNSTRLLTIDPQYITINKNGKEQRVDLATRTSQVPTDPPKRPVAVHTPTGAPIVPVTMTQNGLANPNTAGKPPATFEGARGMGRRGAVEPPQRLGPTSDIKPEQEEAYKAAQLAKAANDQELGERLSKIASEPNASMQTRLELLHRLGVPPGTDAEAAMDQLRANGVAVDQPGIQEAVKVNAKGGG